MKLFRFSVLVMLTSIMLFGCSSGGDGASKGTPGSPESIVPVIVSKDSGTGTFYYPDDIFNEYLTAEKEFDGTAQDVIDTLRELGNYGDNTVIVNSWYIKGDTLYIDFDSGFAKATGSTAQEYFSIYGTVKTLKSCFGVDYVRLTVNGEDFSTPHGAYDLPL